MSLSFKYIQDINGNRLRYPKDPSLLSLFIAKTDESDARFFIYATCTRSDYSEPKLIEVSSSNYAKTKIFFIENFSIVPPEVVMEKEEDIHMLLYSIADAAVKQNKTIKEMLKLD